MALVKEKGVIALLHPIHLKPRALLPVCIPATSVASLAALTKVTPARPALKIRYKGLHSQLVVMMISTQLLAALSSFIQ